jgi:uncharacterized protein
MGKRILKLCLPVALIVALGIVYLAGSRATQATPNDVPPLAPNEQEISLKTLDNVRISASYFPTATPDAPTILLLHGNGASRAQFREQVSWLNDAGFAAMSIDFRGHGESQATQKSFGLFEARDAEAAMAWLKGRSPKMKVGVIGISLGGAAALLPDKGPLNADAMILQAVYPDINRAIGNRINAHAGGLTGFFLSPMLTYQSYFRYKVSPSRISPIQAAKNFKGPALIIGGEQDIYTPPAESKMLSEQFSGSHGLWIIGGLSHDQISSLNDDFYRQRVLLFFNQNLK